MTSLRGELTKKTIYLRDEHKKNGKLREENRRLQSDLRKLEEDHTEMMNKKEYVKSRYNYLVHKLVRPYAQEQNLLWDDQDCDSILVTLQPLIADATQTRQVKKQLLSSQDDIHALEGQVESLQTQVQSLQKQMLDRVDKVVIVSDDQFSQDFRALAALVKSLSRSIRITEDMDIIGILPPGYLHTHVAEHQWASRARKKYYIEAWVWSVLVQRVFSSPFAIFQHIGKGIGTNWECLFGQEFIDCWPVPSSQCENWRYTSMERLVDQVGRSTIMEGQTGMPTESEDVQNLRNHLTRARSAISNYIGGTIALASTGADFSRVSLIVNKAFSLAMEMSLQRSRLQVTWPYIGEQFVKEGMSCVPNPDGEEFEAGRVAFIVNPGLVKWGDANGNNLEERYDIVPSLVHLERPNRRAVRVEIKRE
jgi:hypothetical protein